MKVASGLVIVDPVPLAPEAWEELTAGSPLRAVLLTNGNHVRDTLTLRGSQVQLPGYVSAAAFGTDGSGNLLPPIREALRDRCSMGEVSAALRDVFGRHQPQM